MKPGSSNLVIYGALVGNAAIAVAKFVAAAFTGSSAMISEGIHSTVDTGDQCLLLWGKHRSRQPPDAEHPFGHGKELYFWTLIVAVMIFGVGGGMGIYEGITHLIHPSELTDPTWSYVVLGFAFVFEGASWGIALYEFMHHKPRHRGIWQQVRKSKDPTVFTVLFEDSAAMVGIIIAFLGVLLGHVYQNHYFDGAASVLIGLLLGVVAIFLARESKGLLIGEGMDQEQTEKIQQLVRADPAVTDARQPVSMVLGPEQVLLNLEIAFKRELTLSDLESAVTRLEESIRSKYPSVTRIFIEARSLRPGA